ncbi:MAG: hypothetical protein OIN88_14355 [Candidatus Methanoperedens sp.]|nr:hypothetical protein [Candidatus Methanoperedens sp.]
MEPALQYFQNTLHDLPDGQGSQSPFLKIFWGRTRTLPSYHPRAGSPDSYQRCNDSIVLYGYLEVV